MDPQKSKIVIANYDSPIYEMYTNKEGVAKGRIKQVFDLKEMGLCNEWPTDEIKQEYMNWCQEQPGGRGDGGCDYIPLHNKHPFGDAEWNPLNERGQIRNRADAGHDNDLNDDDAELTDGLDDEDQE